MLHVCDVTNFAYPFERNAMSDIPFEDFDRLFAPGGLIDRFFQENLAPFVDTSMPTWGLKSGTSADFAISDTVIRQMQYAAEIRDAFFSNGATASFDFLVTPEALDPSAEVVVLEIGNQVVQFGHDALPQPTAPASAVGRDPCALPRPHCPAARA